MEKFTFITPVYISEGDELGLKHFKKTLYSVSEQTSPEWSMVIIDDNSNNKKLVEIVNDFRNYSSQDIIFHQNTTTLRPGASRNIGIKIAKDKLDSSYVMFLDADDLNHIKRVEETRKIVNSHHPDIIYSYFIPIDNYDKTINISELSYIIQHILLALLSPPTGTEVWKELYLGKGYVNLTSSTTVNINLALKFPFPEDIHCEDVCTWLQYAMYGANFYYSPIIPSSYRIPNVKTGSISREYIGQKNFNNDFVRSIIRGFNSGISYLISNNQVAPEYIKLLAIKHFDLIESALKQDGFNEIIGQIEAMMTKYKKSDELLLPDSFF